MANRERINWAYFTDKPNVSQVSARVDIII